MVDLNSDSDSARELRALMVEQLRNHLLHEQIARDEEWLGDGVANARGAMNRDVAEIRAIGLLLSWLTSEQRQQWNDSHNALFRFFHCKGSTTGRTYTLTTDNQFNVYCDESDMLDGIKLQRYCAILNALPGDLIGDRLLAQKIAIETDELGFLEIANRQGTLYGGGVPAAVFYSVPDPEPPVTTPENTPCLP